MNDLLSTINFIRNSSEYEKKCKSDFCLVLSSYRRRYLQEQLERVALQTLTPSKILIYHNYHPDRGEKDRLMEIPPSDRVLVTINNNWNAKYHGRFYACLGVDCEDFLILDDDVLPNKKWFELCINAVNRINCILTANGRLLQSDIIKTRNGAANINFEIPLELANTISDTEPDLVRLTTVDYGGHSWACKKQSIEAMAFIRPPSLQNSEDLHISAAAYMKHGTTTLMPIIGRNMKDFYPDILTWERQCDSKASHMQQTQNFMSERLFLAEKWIDSGFVCVKDR